MVRKKREMQFYELFDGKIPLTSMIRLLHFELLGVELGALSELYPGLRGLWPGKNNAVVIKQRR